MARYHAVILWLLIGVVGWAVLAFWLVPRVMESVYTSGQPAFLDGLFNRADPANTLDYYLAKWHKITWAGFAGIIGCAIGWPVVSSRWFFERCVGRATAETLGAIRIMVCAMLLWYALLYNLASTAEIPWEFTFPMGMMSLLETLPIGFKEAIKNAGFLLGLQSIAVASLVLAMIGWRTRWTLAVASVSIFLVAGVVRQHTHLSHPFLIPLYLVVLLNFTPCADAWSLDRRRKAARGESLPAVDQPQAIYGWSRYFCWVLIALPYTISGLQKLTIGGLYWWEPVNLKVHVFASQMTPRGDWYFGGAKPGLWIAERLPDSAFGAMALLALAVETFYCLVLFFPVLRKVIPPLASCMHLGIFVLQKFLFLDMVFYPLLFLDFTAVRKRLQGARASSSAVQPDQATLDARRHGRGFSIVAGVMVLGTLAAGAGRLEKYPFTAWSLFSDKQPRPMASTWQLVQVSRDGTKSLARPEDLVAFYKYEEYQDVVLLGISPKRQEDFFRFLDFLAARYNQDRPVAEQLVRFELEFRRWDFGQDPGRPDLAELTKRISHEVRPAPEEWAR